MQSHRATAAAPARHQTIDFPGIPGSRRESRRAANTNHKRRRAQATEGRGGYTEVAGQRVFCDMCKPLIERLFSGVFRSAKMTLPGSWVEELRYYCRVSLALSHAAPGDGGTWHGEHEAEVRARIAPARPSRRRSEVRS